MALVEASSYSYLHVDYKNLHFEYLNDGIWNYYNISSGYYDDYWYYFPNDVRYYYLGDYYYYTPGWYRYYGGYNYPGAYDFYPLNYYYSGGYFYDSYYYPNYPTYYPNYTGTSYVNYNPYYGFPSYEGTITQYNAPQTSSCGKLSASASSVSISAGDQRKVTVTLRNSGNQTFYISDATVRTHSFDVRDSGIQNDSTISPGSTGRVLLHLELIQMQKVKALMQL